MKNEVLIQKRQRYWYDRCIEASGARLVEFGSAEETTVRDLEKAIGPNTAAVHYVASEQSPDPQAISGEETIEIARAHGVPVLTHDVGANQELLTQGAVVTPRFDEAAAVEALVHLVNDADYRKELGKEAQAYALKEFTWSSVADKYLNIYQTASGGAK